MLAVVVTSHPLLAQVTTQEPRLLETLFRYDPALPDNNGQVRLIATQAQILNAAKRISLNSALKTKFIEALDAEDIDIGNLQKNKLVSKTDFGNADLMIDAAMLYRIGRELEGLPVVVGTPALDYLALTATEKSTVKGHLDKLKTAIVAAQIAWATALNVDAWETDTKMDAPGQQVIAYTIHVGRAMQFVGMAVVHDWLYYEFTEQQRQLVASVMVTRGIAPMMTGMMSRRWWVNAPSGHSNWTTIQLGGAIMASLALRSADFRGTFTTYTGATGTARVPTTQGLTAHFDAFFPKAILELDKCLQSVRDQNGGWDEGPGYTGDFMLPLYAAIISLDHTKRGTLAPTDNLDLGRFFAEARTTSTLVLNSSIHLSGPSGVDFFFANGTGGGWQFSGKPLHYLLANYADGSAALRLGAAWRTFNVFSARNLAWSGFHFLGYTFFKWNSDLTTGLPEDFDPESALPLHVNFFANKLENIRVRGGYSEHIQVWRQRWKDKTSAEQARHGAAVMFKGGDKRADRHDHLDTGTFHYEALGVRWTAYLAKASKSDRYAPALPWLYDNKDTSSSYYSYPKRALGANTLVVNNHRNRYRELSVSADPDRINPDQTAHMKAGTRLHYAPVENIQAGRGVSAGTPWSASVNLRDVYYLHGVKSTVPAAGQTATTVDPLRTYSFDPATGALAIRDRLEFEPAAAGQENIVQWSMHVPADVVSPVFVTPTQVILRGVRTNPDRTTTNVFLKLSHQVNKGVTTEGFKFGLIDQAELNPEGAPPKLFDYDEFASDKAKFKKVVIIMRCQGDTPLDSTVTLTPLPGYTGVASSEQLRIQLVPLSSWARFTTTSLWNWTATTSWSGGVRPSLDPFPPRIDLGGDTVLTAGTLTSVQDLANPLNLYDLTLGGRQPTTGSAVFRLQGNELNFIDPGQRRPTLLLKGSGTHLTHEVSAPVRLSAELAVTGDGTASFQFLGGLRGDGNLSKNGAATLTLGDAIAWSGGLKLQAGTVALYPGAARDRLPATLKPSFLGTATLSLGGNSQTLGKLDVINEAATGTVTGTVKAGQLQLLASGDWPLGPSGPTPGATSTNITSTLDLAGLNRLTVTLADDPATAASPAQPGVWRIEPLFSLGRGTATVKLAPQTTITAQRLQVGSAPSDNNNVHTGLLELGAQTLLNVDEIGVAESTRSAATIQFPSGLTAPALTLRSRPGNGPTNLWTLTRQTGSFSTDTSVAGRIIGMNTGTVDLGTGTYDLWVRTVEVGQINFRGTAMGTFTLGGAGGLARIDQALRLAMARLASPGSTDLPIGTAEGSFQQPSGEVRVRTMTLGGNEYDSTGNAPTLRATYTLGSSTATAAVPPLLRAGRIEVGPGARSSNSSSRLIWNQGTVTHLDAQTDLLITGLGTPTQPLAVTLGALGTRTFDVQAGRTIAVDSSVVLTGPATATLHKTGPGTLVLNAALTGYAGTTSITGGTLAGSPSFAAKLSVGAAAFLSPGGDAPGTQAANTITLQGTFLYRANATGGDLLKATQELNLTGARLVVEGALLAPVTIASYGSLVGTFATVPAGYTITNNPTTKSLTLTPSANIQATWTAYNAWASTHTWNGASSAPYADPDRDGRNNLLEYALNQNPLSAMDASVSDLEILPIKGGVELRFWRARSTLDYTLQSSDDLNTWSVVGTDNPGSVSTTQKVRVQVLNLPALRTFRLSVMARP